jgi:hypothetical protein
VAAGAEGCLEEDGAAEAQPPSRAKTGMKGSQARERMILIVEIASLFRFYPFTP